MKKLLKTGLGLTALGVGSSIAGGSSSGITSKTGAIAGVVTTGVLFDQLGKLNKKAKKFK
jgi:hypothetical protein